MRQWVLAFPHRVRFVLARHPALLSAALSFFVQALFAFQRRRARARGLPTLRAGTSGTVTFVQRFGSALQLTPHFHTLLPDGVFVKEVTDDGNHRQRFVQLDPPQDEEVEWVLARVARRVDRLLAARGVPGGPGAAPADEPTDLLSHTLARAVVLPPKTHLYPTPIPRPDLRPRTAQVEGFSLHADVAVHENDRQGLERLCRYGLRPPLALERLTRTDDGLLRYRMKRTFSDGTRELLLSPGELLRRLCALVPPPRVHITRYHGVFAPNARARRAVTRQGPSRRSRRRVAPLSPVEMDSGVQPTAAAGTEPIPASEPIAPGFAPGDPDLPSQLGASPSWPLRARYLPWAELLRRVHEIDVLRCTRCPGRRRVIAFITDPIVVTAILAHLRLPTQPPSMAPARAPPQQELPLAGLADDDFVDPSPGDPT